MPIGLPFLLSGAVIMQFWTVAWWGVYSVLTAKILPA